MSKVISTKGKGTGRKRRSPVISKTVVVEETVAAQIHSPPPPRDTPTPMPIQAPPVLPTADEWYPIPSFMSSSEDEADYYSPPLSPQFHAPLPPELANRGKPRARAAPSRTRPSPSPSSVDLSHISPVPIPPTIDDPYHALPPTPTPRRDEDEADAETAMMNVLASCKDRTEFTNIIVLAKGIIRTLTPCKGKKSVTSIDRDSVIANARVIIAMAEKAVGTFVENGPPPPELSEIKSTIRSCVKEEMAAFKKEFAPSQPPPPTRPRTTTFADVVRSEASVPKPASPPVSKPAIIVAPKSAVKGPEETLRAWRNCVSFKDTDFAPANVRYVSNNKIRVEFDSTEQRQVALDKVRQNSNCPVEAEPSKSLRPMVVLKGVSNDVPPEELPSILRGQNTCIRESASNNEDLVFKFKRANKNKALYNAVFLVAPSVWRAVIKAEKLNVDHQRVHVEDYIPLLQCYKCLGFGHTKTRCTQEHTICSHCASTDHAFQNCPLKQDTTKGKCHNCVLYNRQHKTNTDTQHSATSNLCPRVAQMKLRVCSRVNYGQ